MTAAVPIDARDRQLQPPVRQKLASGSSTSWKTNNVRRARKLAAKSRQTTCNNIFRWYRSGWGRYTQSDPDWNAFRIRELNGYAYAAENPARFTDPLGLKIEVCCRPLAGAWGALTTWLTGKTHCLIRVTDPPLTVRPGVPAGTLSASANPLVPSGERKLVTRFRYPDDEAYKGPNCQTSPDTCARRQCLAKAFSDFPSGLDYENFGNNSNTFVRSLVAKCGLAAPSDLFHNAPGAESVPIP